MKLMTNTEMKLFVITLPLFLFSFFFLHNIYKPSCALAFIRATTLFHWSSPRCWRCLPAQLTFPSVLTASWPLSSAIGVCRKSPREKGKALLSPSPADHSWRSQMFSNKEANFQIRTSQLNMHEPKPSTQRLLNDSWFFPICTPWAK